VRRADLGTRYRSGHQSGHGGERGRRHSDPHRFARGHFGRSRGSRSTAFSTAPATTFLPRSRSAATLSTWFLPKRSNWAMPKRIHRLMSMASTPARSSPSWRRWPSASASLRRIFSSKASAAFRDGFSLRASPGPHHPPDLRGAANAEGLILSVRPALVGERTIIAGVQGAYNAVGVKGRHGG